MRLPVDIFAVKVASGARAFGNKPLGAIRGHPDHISLGHGMPVVVKAVDTATLEDEETVFHNMDFHEGKGGTRLIGEDVHCHVKTRVRREEDFEHGFFIAKKWLTLDVFGIAEGEWWWAESGLWFVDFPKHC